MDSDNPSEPLLPSVADEFRSKSGIEHASESVRKLSMGAFAALVEALNQEVALETRNVLSSDESHLATARGRLQKITEVHDRVRHFEKILTKAQNLRDAEIRRKHDRSTAR